MTPSSTANGSHERVPRDLRVCLALCAFWCAVGGSVLALVACDVPRPSRHASAGSAGSAGQGEGEGEPGGNGAGEGEGEGTPPLPSAAVCTDAPAGRGYVGLAGEALDIGRADVAAGYDTHRPIRSFTNSDGRWVLALDIQKAVGNSPITYEDNETSDPGFGGSFGTTPDGWYSESEVGTFAVYMTYKYAFKACLREFDAERTLQQQPWYEHVAFEPTQERATAFCTGAQRKAWLREPTAVELQSCVDLALDLAEEPDFKRRWAYVCAAVVSSASWLSN